MSNRPMTGAYAPNPHEGSRSEILADYLFSSWGTVTPVRRQDDYGVDLYCTLSDRIGQRAVVRDYFVVQVKSGNDAWMFGKAMFTIVTSRKLMNTATDATTRTCHLRCMMKRTLDDCVASRNRTRL